jgi:hypothetical protein
MSNHISAATSNAAPTASHANRSTAAKKGSGASFAEMHAAAVRTAKDEDTKTHAAKSTAKTVKGEKTEKVEGHNYAEIVAGPRNGMFINMSDNSRSGEAFVMVKRDGRQFHVYGAGEDRAVYEVGRRAAAAKPTTGTSVTGTGPATT